MFVLYARVPIKDVPEWKKSMFTQADYKAPRVKK